MRWLSAIGRAWHRFRQTPAERHQELVEAGATQYRDTFIRVFVAECTGGQVPGTMKMSDDGLRSFFHANEPAYFYRIAERDPQRALGMLREFQRVEGL